MTKITVVMVLTLNVNGLYSSAKRYKGFKRNNGTERVKLGWGWNGLYPINH